MKHKRSSARTSSIKFLYQCESEKIFYFSESHFNCFCKNFGLNGSEIEHARGFCTGVLQSLEKIDSELQSASQKWPVSRMPSIDRNVLRLATYELLASKEPIKVILNEAIEIAKTYGTENSGKFVNGILDTLAKKIRQPEQD